MPSWTRRGVCIALGTAVVPMGSLAALDPLGARIRRAILFAYPVHTMLRTRAAAIAHSGNFNRLNHRRTLSGPADRNVTTPNNDTLYSAGWLDLSAGPLVLTMPRAPELYHSAALLDLFTDNDAVLGTRATGGRGGRVLLAGPDWRDRAPGGIPVVRARTNDAWLIVRVLVAGQDDMAAAQAVQASFALAPLTAGVPRALAADPGDADDPEDLIAAVNEALARGTLTGATRRRLRGLGEVGLSPGRTQAWAALSEPIRAAWRATLPEVLAELRQGLQATGVERNGWSYPKPGMGDFGDNDLYRGQVALGGLGALPIEEAIYLSCRTDAAGRPLVASRAYQLRIPPDVPVAAFWSLSLYEIAADGRLFFTANPIQRYALGDRTPGLTREADGSVIINIQREPPGDARNWLPSPAGPFSLTFRGYLPGAELRAGRWQLPAITAVS